MVVQEPVVFEQSAAFGGAVYLYPQSVKDADVSDTAAIQAKKVLHLVQGRLTQVHGTAATAERRIVHVAKGAGTVKGFRAVPVVAITGNSTQSWNLLKNGTSVLTGGTAIILTNAHAAYAKLTATLDSALVAYVAGDVFEVTSAISAGSGTLPQGSAGVADFHEAGE